MGDLDKNRESIERAIRKLREGGGTEELVAEILTALHLRLTRIERREESREMEETLDAIDAARRNDEE